MQKTVLACFLSTLNTNFSQLTCLETSTRQTELVHWLPQKKKIKSKLWCVTGSEAKDQMNMSPSHTLSRIHSHSTPTLQNYQTQTPEWQDQAIWSCAKSAQVGHRKRRQNSLHDLSSRANFCNILHFPCTVVVICCQRNKQRLQQHSKCNELYDIESGADSHSNTARPS